MNQNIIFINGNIYTMDNVTKQAQAIVTDDNLIKYVGTNEEALRMKTDCHTVIDLRGKTVVPGFNDSHMHLVSFGYSKSLRVNLSKCKSLKELIEKGKSYTCSKSIPSESWIIGRGWNQDNFSDVKKIPSRYDLDEISTENPIIFIRSCNSVASINSKAVELCGCKQIDGILIGRDIIDDVYSKIPEPTVEEIKYMISSAAEYALSKGVTSCQTDDFETFRGRNHEKILKAYKELENEGNLNIRIYEQCRFNDYDAMMNFMNADMNANQCGDLFKLGPIKLITDGGLTYRTAYLNEPYADDNSTCGKMNYSREQIDAIVKEAYYKNMQITMHCIGDKAMDIVFDSFEKVATPDEIKKNRYSIIHCQITSDYNLKRFKELGVIAHIQPIFINYDWNIAELRVGRFRVEKSYNWKTMLEQGIITAIGTDCPEEDLNPMDNIYSAVTRKDLCGNPEQGWLLEQKISVYEAVYGYTVNSAYASFEENIKGSLEKGKFADFVILENNIFEIDPNEIKDTKVEMTVFNGKVVYAVNKNLK